MLSRQILPCNLKSNLCYWTEGAPEFLTVHLNFSIEGGGGGGTSNVVT